LKAIKLIEVIVGKLSGRWINIAQIIFVRNYWIVIINYRSKL